MMKNCSQLLCNVLTAFAIIIAADKLHAANLKDGHLNELQIKVFDELISLKLETQSSGQ
jgi:hypothetical protein